MPIDRSGNIALSQAADYSGESVRIVGTGDIMLAKAVETKILTEGPESILCDVVPVLNSGDLLFGNLECPISDAGKPIFKTSPRHRASPQTMDLLRYAGYDILSLANNHIKDYGPAGLLDTLTRLNSEKIAFVGAGQNRSEASGPRILSVRGQQIAFLAFCDREESIATDDTPGCAEAIEEAIIQRIEEVKFKVDHIVLSLHCGVEFVDFPSPFQVEMCHRLVDAGVRVIFGHHPHVPQGIELYGDGIIFHSLGNFVFQMTPPKTNVGYIAKVELCKEGLCHASVMPYRFTGNLEVMLLEGKKRQQMIDRINSISEPIGDTEEMQFFWYKTCRSVVRQSLKVMFQRTFLRHKFWFPFVWLKMLMRPQSLRIWRSHLRFALTSYGQKRAKLATQPRHHNL